MKKKNLAQIATYKGTHSIAEMKPKVKVIHTQTPVVLEIEPTNFQTFVQSHTGNFTGTKTELKKPESAKNTTFAPAVHKVSHSIAKMKPKVRVIHIPTPEVMEIEPANFQNIVQILTGKSIRTTTKLKEQKFSTKEEPMILCDDSSNSETKILNGFLSSFDCKERSIAGEEEMTSWEIFSDESFIGLEDLDKFINELIDFPLYP